MTELNQTPQLDILAASGSYYSCMDCDWAGDVVECDLDAEYDEFRGSDRKHPICPKCGGGLNF